MSLLNKFSLREHIALVTGASSGIGRAVAIAFSEAGAKVLLLARRKSMLVELREEINERGGEAAVIVCDLSRVDNWDKLAERAAQDFGPPDILVNNAGVNLRESWQEISDASWDVTMDLNLKTPFFLTRALIPHMAKRRWGKILNIASLQSERAFPNSIPYGASKGGVAQLTRAMSEAWSGQGIMVNAIAPGFFPTELTQPVFEKKERLEELARQTTIGRNGRLDDLVGAAVFLCSPAADYITGQTLYVDGGFTAK